MYSFAYRFAIPFLGLCAFVFVSCGEQPAHDAQPASEPQASALTEPIAEHMGEHYEQVDAAQKALIRGNLEGISGPVTGWPATSRWSALRKDGHPILRRCERPRQMRRRLRTWREQRPPSRRCREPAVSVTKR